MLFIFIQSALPGDVSGAESNYIVSLISKIMNIDVEAAKFMVRKAAHFTEYMILGGCLLLNVMDWNQSAAMASTGTDASTADRTLKARQVWGLAWILATAYAFTDELHQRFVPLRSGELRDVCIDAAGAAIGAGLVLLIVYIIHPINLPHD